MSNEQTISDQSKDTQVARKSNTGVRLLIILGMFGLAVAGIYGMQYFLDAQIPTGDGEFVRERNEDAETEEPESGLEIIADMFSGPGESKEITELKGLPEDQVAFSFEQISQMSKADLEKNIADLSKQLGEIRSKLGPSFGGATMGEDSGEKKVSKVKAIALPLEVMRQVLNSK